MAVICFWWGRDEIFMSVFGRFRYEFVSFAFLNMNMWVRDGYFCKKYSYTIKKLVRICLRKL